LRENCIRKKKKKSQKKNCGGVPPKDTNQTRPKRLGRASFLGIQTLELNGAELLEREKTEGTQKNLLDLIWDPFRQCLGTYPALKRAQITVQPNFREKKKNPAFNSKALDFQRNP